MHTLEQIASLLGLPVAQEHRQRVIRGVAALDEAGPDDISFLASDAFVRQFKASHAGAVIVDKKIPLKGATSAALLIAENAEAAFSRVLNLFAPPVPRPATGIDPAARVDTTASVDPTAAVASFVVIGARSRIGRNTRIHPGVCVGSDVIIGDDCELFPNVVIRERITIGHRVTIHAGSVLGTDGFGYRWDGKQHAKIPQIGMVVIEDDVEIGSCVCIDRAKMGVTRVGQGTKIDNLVQIAHNCQIGPHCIIVGQVGLAGSVRLGAGVVLGGQSAVRDHIRIGDGAMAAARSAIAEDVDAKTTVSGMPAFPHRQSLREQAALRRLPELVVQVRKLQDEIEKLKSNLKP